MRKPIFDTIRAQRGKGFTAEEVKAIDALLDRLGIEEDDAAVAPTTPDLAPTVPAAAGTAGLDNPQAFFDSVRESGVLGSALKPDQVKGLEAVLGAAKTAGWPLAFTAYALATAAATCVGRSSRPRASRVWTARKRGRKHLIGTGHGY